MKSKRAMIDRRNAERRARREQKNNPPGPFFKLFDRLWTTIYVLFLLSLSIVAICHWFLDTGPIPFAAERFATLMLFIILATACVVGVWVTMKPTNDSSSRKHKQPEGKRVKVMKFFLLLFFALIIIISAIICWAQLQALMGVWGTIIDKS